MRFETIHTEYHHPFNIILSVASEDFAPDGFYFGSHIGDGSDFGFWEMEELCDE